jgi:hypothetical protein
MIIRPANGSQLLITQPDHAALAADIMRHWQADGLPDSPRRALILFAICEHDNGWAEVDAAPIVDASSGRILDFVNAPDVVRRDVWPRGVERLAAMPYAAALLAQHALHIYRRYHAASEWAPFFLEMQAARDRHLEAVAAVTLDDLLRDYFFLRIGDLASLTFCNGWTDIQTDESGYAVHLEGARLIVTPDPFGGAVVPIEVCGREVPNHPFGSAEEARAALSGARPVTLNGAVSGKLQK